MIGSLAGFNPLYYSVDYKPILVTATASGSANDIELGRTGTSGASMACLWASNLSASAVALNIGWGGVTDALMLIKACSIPPNSMVPLTWGEFLPLRNADTIKAWAGTGSVITIFGASMQVDSLSDVDDYKMALLSSSTNGRPVTIDQTAIATGTTVHQVANTTLSFDTALMMFSNIDTVARTLTLGHGGVTDPDHLIHKGYSIPASSFLFPIAVPLRNNLIIKAAASSANVINFVGKVLRRGLAA